MLIIANWKAYVGSKRTAKALFETAKKAAAGSKTEVILAPSAPYIGMLAVGNRSKVGFAAQDVSVATGGAATGEITAAQLADLGVTHAIIGHSERRARGEDNATVTLKVEHALAHGLIPILCVGEPERDTDAHYLKFVRTQLADVFKPLSLKERAQIIVAYEPIWAIGKTAAQAITPDDLSEMVLYVRKVLGDFLPGKSAPKNKIIYGGSVEPGNAKILARSGGVEGFLVGHASVEPTTFAALIKAAS